MHPPSSLKLNPPADTSPPHSSSSPTATPEISLHPAPAPSPAISTVTEVERSQVSSTRSLTLVRQGSCVKEEHARFSCSIPAAYDRYLGPILFQPYAEDLAARLPIKTTTSVLELACGTGILTRVLRTYLPSKVKLIATDLNDPMFRQAAAKFGKGREGTTVGSRRV
jgi:hypothetical protein